MSTREAGELMSEHQIRRLPVVENDRLVGIVSIGDLAVSAARHYSPSPPNPKSLIPNP